MISINGINNNNNSETDQMEDKEQNLLEENNNLIGILKPVDIMNNENQQGFNRVHVLCCSKCDFLTIRIESLHEHLELYHSIPSDVFNELTIYSCQECQCVSTELKLIKEHIKMFHEISSDSISSKSRRNRLHKRFKPLHFSALRIHRNTIQTKFLKNQMKIRRKISARKSDRIYCLDSADIAIRAGPDYSIGFANHDYSLKSEVREMDPKMSSDPADKDQGTLVTEEAHEMSKSNENDPLDMSISSVTCPFKGIKSELMDRSNSQNKHDFVSSENLEAFINSSNNNIINNAGNYNASNNSIINNPLLTNPQTCIELIKLTLGQMLAKTNDQTRLPLPGFNPASFLQPQFQLPPNIIPLLLPTLAPVSNSSQIPNQSDLSFNSQNPEIDSILSNLQQHNLLKNPPTNSYDPSNHLLTHQQSTMYLNHKSARSSPNISKNLFIDSIPKNGNGTLSPIYSSKKSADSQSKLPQKRQFKKSQIQSRIRSGLSENINYLQKTEQTNENLFNRSFLDSSLSLESKTDQIDLNKVLEKHDSSCDLFDSHTNTSNKSSPGGLASDKPHRQNFTSQQNRILSDWFFTHCDKPYPSTEDTKELSQLSGLTYSQVKKWFANKRARSSLNKKGHKNYCLITPAESTMEEMGNNEMCSDGLLAISPSSGSQNAYNSSIIKSLAGQHASPTPLDYTQLHQDELQSPEK